MIIKKRLLIRIILIGILHSSVYLYLIPYVILPMFGKSSVKLAIAVTVLISLLILATALISKKSKKDSN